MPSTAMSEARSRLIASWRQTTSWPVIPRRSVRLTVQPAPAVGDAAGAAGAAPDQMP